MVYIMKAFFMAVKAIPLSVFILLIWYIVSRIRNTDKTFTIKVWGSRFFFAVYGITVLEITGIIGMQFRIKWFVNALGSIGCYLPSGLGEMKMMLLNLGLFIPLGIFLPIIYDKVLWNWKKILLTGTITSLVIEFLQMFGGRMAEVDDVIMNVAGTLVGFVFFRLYYKWYTKNK